MMRISLESPALIAVREWLAGSTTLVSPRARRNASRTRFHAERLEPRMMLDAGMRAFLPDLVDSSDTGSSSTDNFTSDRTPSLTGSVLGGVSQVRLFIDGRHADQVPVTNGTWAYAVPAEAALAAGKHRIAVRPVDTSGRVGRLSNPLIITTATTPPAAPTITIAQVSDSGMKGDGRTIVSNPVIRGVAARGQSVSVEIDGVSVGRVQSHARTGVWSLTLPRLANGVREITAVTEDRAGLRSAATSFTVTIDGERTVMLDASNGQTVELMASHLLGRGSQGFTVTQVHRGTLQKWSAVNNAWITIPMAPLATDAATLRKAPAIRQISFSDRVRWTPASGDVGLAPAFAICPRDTAGGATAPAPVAGTVPGKVVSPRIARMQGVGNTLTWSDPIDGCGCPSTRYSIEVTRQDGRTLLYNVPSSVHGIPVVEGGAILQARLWGATKTGAGRAQSYDAVADAESLGRLTYTLTSAASFTSLSQEARAQLEASITPTRFVTSLPLGSRTDLAYLEVSALPDATEAALGLPAGTPLIVSSESNALTPGQRAGLQSNPIYASHLFPGTVDGVVQPDQVRAHFQAGEVLQFAGNVDARVRAGATVVLEEAQNLGDGSLGPWFEKARTAVGADGSYAHAYVVPYGLRSVRVRLEYATQPAPTAGRALAASSVGTSTSSSAPIVSTQIDLSNNFNAFGITTPPWQVANHQGFDRNGNYYNSDYTGSPTANPYTGLSIQYNGIEFPIGPVPTANSQVGGKNGPSNFVQARGQTINVSVDADKSDYLYLAGAASNGNQMSQAITLQFTDGTTETWYQSFHDWASVGPPQQDAQPQNQQTNPKLPVMAATTGPLQSLSGPQTIDGVAVVAGDRVLVMQQSAAADNGVYVVADGAWTRAKDADTGPELLDASMTVVSGNTYAGDLLVNTNTGSITLGSTPISFATESPPVPAPRPFKGELLLKTEPERINQEGDLVATPAHVFAYCRNLHGKQLARIILPSNENVGILSAVVAKAPVIAVDEGIASVVLGTTNLTGIDVMALTIKNESNIGVGGSPLTFFFADQPVAGSVATPSQPATYATKSVTVPMGQQATIAYVAPDDSSQMTFYVQKADGSCVGPNCSTYLTDWNDGSGRSQDFAANVGPSLNSQMKSGQHWTMTIQNAGEGYYGYLDSPSGQGLPSGSSNTPAGAQFKLMTQAEIDTQPAWATALEEFVGTLVGVAILTVLTGGAIDAYLLTDAAIDTTVDAAGEMTVTVSGQTTVGGTVTETLTTDTLSDLADTEDREADIFLNLDSDSFSDSQLVRKDSLNDIFDKLDRFDVDTYQRMFVRGGL